MNKKYTGDGIMYENSTPNTGNVAESVPMDNMKFCKHCGSKIPKDAVLCVHCGRQVEELAQQQAAQPQIVINNENTNVNSNVAAVGAGYMGKPINKWVAFALCLFLGLFGVHKFYEGKIGSGLLYLFTFGLCGIGWIIDCIIILLKPNPYYVR